MDDEMAKFQADLLASVEQMTRGEAARRTEVELSPVAAARVQVGMSQREFAELLGVSARTLQDWEQGRREPTGAARTLLRVAVRHPEVLRELSEPGRTGVR
jgi:putative transcriptional regulator